MLVSHRKNFIYTKTAKTAGTSVESYFEKYCMPEGAWTLSETRSECISEAGIVGHRGPDAKGATWRNHMPASEIKERLGEAVWDSYFKFCVIRNPFDKMVSGFTMLENRWLAGARRTGVRAWLRKLRGKSSLQWSDKPTKIERFRAWIRDGELPTDRDKYMIGGEPCLDHYILFEDLNDGIKAACERLGLPYEPENLPKFKMGDRVGDHPVRDYYDAATEAIVAELCDWEIKRFGYRMP